jgi:uncharacterized protein (TIGR02466 family)
MTMSQFIDLFALSVYRDDLQVDENQRAELSREVLEMEKRSSPQRGQSTTGADDESESAWLGDTSGFEFLFQRESFSPLFKRIGDSIKRYTQSLGLNNEKLSFYFQRSWATVSREGERIFEHAHVQSHLSFAYYLQKPADGGGIYFSIEHHPNELAPGLFTLSKESLGILENPNERTLNRIYVEPHEGEILIFPSKTLHSTSPNMTQQPRISISADVVIALKDSHGHETLMPAIQNWQSF